MANIVLIGSGNVATQLGRVLYNAGHSINQVFSRNIENAKILSSEIKSIPIDNLNEMNVNADFYIISIADDAINTIISTFEKIKGNVVHTSGSVGIEVFKDKIENYGIIYPLQSFNKDFDLDFEKVPFCIEANSESNLLKIKELTSVISKNIFEISSNQRQYLHLAAVFVNNFANSLYVCASDILENQNIPFELLKPLILETALKVQHNNPITTQTGPAKRNDFKIIEKHLHLLQKKERYKNLYQDLSNLITIQQNKEKDGQL